MIERMGNNVLRCALIGYAALLINPAADAQRVLIVDKTGAGGAYKSIGAAVAAFRTGDQILVRTGVYEETITLDGKNVSILGIGPTVGSVVLRIPTSKDDLVVIKNHPANRTSRFSRITLDHAASRAVYVHDSRGDIVFDQVHSPSHFVLYRHDGVIAITESILNRQGTSFDEALFTYKVRHLFIEGSRFDRRVDINSSRATLSHTSIQGGGGWLSPWGPLPGSLALGVSDSTIRITGLATDIIAGGDGFTTGSYSSAGGVGIDADSSTVVYSGVTLRGGLGRLFGGPVTRAPGFSTSKGATVTRGQRNPPVLSVRPATPPVKTIARGANTVIDLYAAARARSMTWVAVDYAQPFATPWGDALIDLTKPALLFNSSHDAIGKATFELKLKNLPVGFVGKPYVIQTLALDTGNQLSLSGPRLGVIGY